MSVWYFLVRWISESSRRAGKPDYFYENESNQTSENIIVNIKLLQSYGFTKESRMTKWQQPEIGSKTKYQLIIKLSNRFFLETQRTLTVSCIQGSQNHKDTSESGSPSEIREI